MHNTTVAEKPYIPSLIAVSEDTPPIVSPIDAEVDMELLRVVPKAFAVVDEKTASWVVRRVVAAREYGEKVRDWAIQERRRAEREEECLMYLYGRQMQAWVAEEIAKANGKRKSVTLPGGTIGFRMSPRKTVIDNEKAVIEWAKLNCPQAVVLVEKIAKVIMDSYIFDSGHVPEDGLHVEAAAEKFYIR